MSTTWINCHIKFSIPSEEALNIVAKIDVRKMEASNKAEIEKFLVENIGENFDKKYNSTSDVKRQNKELQKVMEVFQYTFEMMIGQEDIQRNHVTQKLLMNKTMEIKYDFLNVPKGKDARKFFTLTMEQYAQKAEKQSYTEMAMKASGYNKSQAAAATADPVFFQLDRGNKDL